MTGRLPRRGGGRESEGSAAITITSVIWDSTFLVIRVAVEHVPPSVVVFGRALLGASFSCPCPQERAFHGLRRSILPVLGVTLPGMGLLPTVLTA